jgi:hypothetical protein
MDKPGLQRALPYMLVTFVASLIFVYTVRSLQNMDPIWVNDVTSEGAQVGFVLAAFASMGGFMLGMGAFDPKMSVHGGHVDENADAPEKNFQFTTDGWLYHLGNVQYQHALDLIDAKPTSVTFLLPGETNAVNRIIGYYFWIPLFITLTLSASIASVLCEIKAIEYRRIDVASDNSLIGFLANRIFNLLLLPVWIIGAISVRGILFLMANIWLALGVPLMAVSWALQIVSFYMGQVLLIATLSIVLIFAMFAFALLPTGLSMQTANEPNADIAANGFGEFVIPINEIVGLLDPATPLTNQPIPETSQFAVFLGFIVIVFVSLALAGGLIALFFYITHQGLKEIQEIPQTDEELTPPVLLQDVGKVAGAVNRVIYAIPNFIGYKK